MFTLYRTVPDPLDKAGGGRGGGKVGAGLQKHFFRPFRPQFRLKIRGRGPRVPPLDPLRDSFCKGTGENYTG